jgi:replicative DNA helicase
MSEYDEKLFSIEAERAILGCILINPDSRFDISLREDDFFIERHRKVWAAMARLDASHSAIDVLTVSEASGIDIPYLSSLVDLIPTSLHIADYARVVGDKSKRRKYFDLARRMVNAAHDERSDIDAEGARIVDGLVEASVRPGGAVHISAFTGQVMAEVDQRRVHPQEYWGLRTGFVDFDRLTGGVQPGESIILSGEPGVGKSLLVMQIGIQLAEHGAAGAIYSLEMQGTAVARRMISGAGKVNTRKIKLGNLDDEEYASLSLAKARIDNLPIWMSESGDWDLLGLRADLARMKRQQGIKWFILDYLYLLNAGPGLNEIEATTTLSRGIKVMCRSLDLAGITIHSMSKSGMDTKAIGKSSLRGSGQIAYDADLICMLTRDDVQENVRHFQIVKGRELERDVNTFSLIKHNGYPFFGSAETSKISLARGGS